MRRALLLLFLAACQDAPTPKLDIPTGFRDLAEETGIRSGEVYVVATLANISEDDLYRLEKLGIRSVVTFRTMVDMEMNGKDELPDGAKLIWAPVKKESTDHETSFLRAVAEPENRPMVVQSDDESAIRILQTALAADAALRKQLVDAATR